MQLLHGDAELLDGVLLLDARAEDVGLDQLDELFGLVLVEVVDDLAGVEVLIGKCFL